MSLKYLKQILQARCRQIYETENGVYTVHYLRIWNTRSVRNVVLYSNEQVHGL
jgi:hypothetical protein